MYYKHNYTMSSIYYEHIYYSLNIIRYEHPHYAFLYLLLPPY